MTKAGAGHKASTPATLLVLLLGIAVFFNYVDRGAIGIAAPLMTTELKLRPEAFGLILSAFFWVYAPVQLAVGWLVDRFSVTKLIAAGVLLWAAATLAMGVVSGFTAMLLLRVLLGMGETVAFPGASKIITRIVPAERRGAANSALALGIALGPAAGTLAGGLILASYGWRAIFVAFGALTLLWLLPWLLAARDRDFQGGTEEQLRVPVRALVGKWSLWSMCIAHVASNYVFYFLLGWLPLFLTKSRGLPVREMTYVATIGYAVQAVAAIAFGYASDRWTRGGRSEATIRRAMMFTGQLLAAAAVAALPFADSGPKLAGLLCLAGVATGALSLNTYAVAQMFSGPRAAGTWVGIQNAIGNTSGIFGPILTGWIVQRAGYSTACIITAAIAAAGALWWLVGVPKIEQIEVD
jgi:MFS family permease